MSATWVVGCGQERQQICVAELRSFDQRDAGVSDFAQVVAGDFGRHAHRDTTRAIEKCKWQTRGQLLRFFGGAVVVGLEVNRTFVNLVEQQSGDFGQARFGVTHGGGSIAVARTEVTLSVDERVALRKVLRHTHKRFIGGAVAVGVVAAEYIADYACAFDGFGAGVAAEAQAHAGHGIQDAALHRFLAIAHIGQGAAFDYAQGVFQVGALGVVA